MKWYYTFLFLLMATTLGYTQCDLTTSRGSRGMTPGSIYPMSCQKTFAVEVPNTIVPKAVRTLTLQDGTIVHLDVSAPVWSWFYGGLIYQPTKSSLTAYKNVRQRVSQWWCVYLCTRSETVKQPVKVSALTLEALGYTGNAAGDQVTDQGRSACSSCSSITHYVHNFGLLPWAGAGGFLGIGFRGTVYYQGQTLVLHDHWGTDRTPNGAPAFPADFD
jgi:hypothetical protein